MSGLLDGMSWYDWVGVASVLIEVPLTVAGFAITFASLRTTRRAVERAESRIAKYQVLMLFPHLQELERDLDASILGDDRAQTIRHLVAWRLNANQLNGLLRELNEGASLRQDLQTSVALASEAKTHLVETRKAISGATRNARNAIAAVNDSAAVLAAQLASRSSSGGTE